MGCSEVSYPTHKKSEKYIFKPSLLKIKMPRKSEREMKKEKHFLINYTSLILLIIFLVIPLSFFLLLSINVQGKSFGLMEIAFSIISSVLITSFLSWNKRFTLKNPYLGTIMGLVVLAFLEYALFIKYSGPYTLSFAIISAMIVLGFLGMNFIKGLKAKREDYDNYYEEEPAS